MYDIFFIIIMICALTLGYHNGFLKAVVGLLSVVVSAVGGFLLFQPVTELLKSTPLYTMLLNQISNFLAPKVETEGLPDLLVKYGVDTLESAANEMAAGITVVILNIISVVLILILIKLVFYFLKKSSKWINELPVIGKVNRILGMVVSGASAIVLIFIFVAVILMPPSNETEFSKGICRGINQSYLVNGIMEYNFFANYRSLSNVE